MSEFLLAEFESKQQAAEAARAAAEAGYAPRDVLSPSPIEDATDYVAPPRSYSPIGWVMFIAGATGTAIGYLMQRTARYLHIPPIPGAPARQLAGFPARTL